MSALYGLSHALTLRCLLLSVAHTDELALAGYSCCLQWLLPVVLALRLCSHSCPLHLPVPAGLSLGVIGRHCLWSFTYQKRELIIPAPRSPVLLNCTGRQLLLSKGIGKAQDTFVNFMSPARSCGPVVLIHWRTLSPEGLNHLSKITQLSSDTVGIVSTFLHFRCFPL